MSEEWIEEQTLEDEEWKSEDKQVVDPALKPKDLLQI